MAGRKSEVVLQILQISLVVNTREYLMTAPNEAQAGANGAKQNPAEAPDKEFTIIVNAEEKRVTGKELTFDQVVQLAFPGGPQGETRLYTVTYRRGEGNKPEGTLVKGESVKLKNGMIFNVTATDKS
ncbi:multiubiquitin domain-containing protein [Archangium gephyra]|uniref:multiubiquitin domain-containing protein n=1 Tax=Archangium gephyra TaxID=48 RepID=UPI0035D44E2B